MARRFINELGEREDIDDVFLASDKQLRPNRNGNLYLQLRLSDRTGSVNAIMCNANDRVYQAFSNGDYVHIHGTSQVYNGTMQIILTQIDAAEPRNINEADFVYLTDQQRDALQRQLAVNLRSIENLDLKNLAECFLIDDHFMQRFSSSPAGVKHHHAYAGGLLQHVVDLMEVVRAIAPKYPQLNADLLLMGAFLHDVGKIDELIADKGLAYSDEGQLVGHLVQGVTILDRKIQEVERMTKEDFPTALAVQLKHMIVSHHGKLEFGSPKVPMTLEALALHYLDDLDAKLHSFEQLIREDVNIDSSWTTYYPHLGRKLFKPAESD
jgi:3'-5' exoribonuclease